MSFVSRRISVFSPLIHIVITSLREEEKARGEGHVLAHLPQDGITKTHGISTNIVTSDGRETRSRNLENM